MKHNIAILQTERGREGGRTLCSSVYTERGREGGRTLCSSVYTGPYLLDGNRHTTITSDLQTPLQYGGKKGVTISANTAARTDSVWETVISYTLH